MDDEEPIKVILLGESGVGKTNLINIVTGAEFNDSEASTGTSSFLQKMLTVKGNKYPIKLWDTIGQEKLRHLTKLFYNNSKIVIFVYDITRKDTFEQIKTYWVKSVEEILGKKIIKGLVANKIDLFQNEQVTEEEGEEYAKSINALFIATSAKTDGPAKFEGFLTKLYEQYLNANGAITKESKDSKNIVLDPKKNVGGGSRGKKCC